MIQLLHNTRCGKSRDCLALLKESKVEFQIIKYLEKPPTFDQLNNIIQKLGIKPIDLVRKSEKIWIENYKSKTFTDDEVIEIMVKNPILIERPIVINKEKAVIARPFDLAKTVM
jgi:arsenate reductase (glutaredoxin)